jgi:hypothetical protein
MLPICRHILTNGEQCRSLRLNGQDFCYFHNRLHARHKATLEARPERPLVNSEGVVIGHGRPVGFQAARLPDLGPLEDRASVQMAISTVVNALATEAMDVRRATALLYGLQLASNNCASNRNDHSTAKDPVETIVTTDDGTMLAPADRIPPEVIARERTARMLQSMLGDMDDEEDEYDEDEEAYDESLETA